MTESPPAQRGAQYLYDALVDAEIDLLVGIPGTQTLPLDRIVVQREEIRYVMARHETAVPHIAWGYYEASGRLAATLTVPGPGDTNAIHGLKNALEDSVPLVHISADVDPEERARKPIHEIDPTMFDAAVKENVLVEKPGDLPAVVARGIERACSPPYGPVRLGVPSGVLAAEFSAPRATVTPERVDREHEKRYDVAADRLADARRPVVLAGGGVRRSIGGAEVASELAAALDAPVVSTYKGKGTVPEDDRFLGVTGSHLAAGAQRVLAAADVVLALGTDFDGVNTAGWTLPMGESLVHVTLDPAAIDIAYPADVALVDDVTTAGEAIRERLDDRPSPGGWDGAAVATAVRREYLDHLQNRGLLDGDDPLYTPAVLRTVREVLPTGAVVTTDVGGFRLWALQVFETHGPDRFVTAGSWAGMGVGLPAAIGAKLAHPDRPVVCLSGDGGLLMCVHELHTAAEYDLDLLLVVFNNADYGVISQSRELRRYAEARTFGWQSPSFATVAEGFGWSAEAVADADELVRAVDDALERGGPTLIDVDIATEEPTAAEAADYESTLTF